MASFFVNLTDTGHDSHEREDHGHQDQSHDQGQDDDQGRLQDTDDRANLALRFSVVGIGDLLHDGVNGAGTESYADHTGIEVGEDVGAGQRFRKVGTLFNRPLAGSNLGLLAKRPAASFS